MTSGFASRVTSKAASKWPVLAGGRARGAPQFTTSPGNGTAPSRVFWKELSAFHKKDDEVFQAVLAGDGVLVVGGRFWRAVSGQMSGEV